MAWSLFSNVSVRLSKHLSNFLHHVKITSMSNDVLLFYKSYLPASPFFMIKQLRLVFRSFLNLQHLTSVTGHFSKSLFPTSPSLGRALLASDLLTGADMIPCKMPTMKKIIAGLFYLTHCNFGKSRSRLAAG